MFGLPQPRSRLGVDPEVAAAIEKLLKHSDSKIQEAARAALANWSPEFGVRQKLNAAYSSHMPVESTERFVESTTPLYVGQILQFQQSQGPWYSGEVVELLHAADAAVALIENEHDLPALILIERNRFARGVD